jgi:YfiR/HmsC-like
MGILSRATAFRAALRSELFSSLLLVLAAATAAPLAKDISLEYQVKAAYLLNFAKFVEWPADSRNGPITICVAGQNPFGGVLEETLRGEMVNDRPLALRLIQSADPACHIVFVPQGTPTVLSYLRPLRDAATLTVGEAPDFINQGGIINFVLEDGKVRFQIDPKAAGRTDLRISSHLLRLARTSDRRGER